MRHVTAVLVLTLLLVDEVCAQDLPEKAAELRQEFAADHVQAAQKCLKTGLWEEARIEYEVALRLDASNRDAASGVEGLDSERVLNWSKGLHKKYLAWRAKHGKSTMGEARKLAALLRNWPEDQAEEGKALARLAVGLDGACKKAREHLGESHVKTVGWVPEEEAKRYRRKLTPWGKEWVPASSVAGKQPEWKDAWEFRGEHFVVRCNAGQTEGRTTLAWAEEVNHAFRREFRGLLEFETPADGMKIYHFKDRADLDEHNRTAHGDRPALKRAPGFFSNEDQIGHFYPVVTSSDSTTLEEIVRHETTHQLAYFAMPARANPTSRPHFWVWEGLACYFESVENRDGKILIGGADQLRIRLGRQEVLSGGFVPWKEFLQASQREVQGKYPQAATMVHFLMNAREGAYRKKFVEYARKVHEGSAEQDTFEEIFEAKPERMESEWVSYVRRLK